MAMQGEGTEFAENIRPFLRRMRDGSGGGGGGGEGASPRASNSWMLHPLVQNVMMAARAQGATEFEAMRVGYAVHERISRGETTGEGPSPLAGLPLGVGGAPGSAPGRENISMVSTLGRLLCGLLVGSFLGWMSIFFLLNASTNRTFKAGVMAGVLINIVALSFTAQDVSPSSSSAPRGSGEGGGVWGNPNDSPWAYAVGMGGGGECSYAREISTGGCGKLSASLIWRRALEEIV